jgi:hypothetical protein
MNNSEQIESLRLCKFDVYPYDNAVIKCPPLEDVKKSYDYGDILKLMRPGSSDPRGSYSGFLDENEDLISLLLEDMEKVKGLNTTHQVLALLLWNTIAKDPDHIITFSEAHLKGGNGETEIEGPTGKIVNINYNIGQTQGSQYSPFYDEYASSIAVTLTGGSTAKCNQLSFGGIQIALIYKWGFYEGNVPGRIDPLDIWSLFT